MKNHIINFLKIFSGLSQQNDERKFMKFYLNLSALLAIFLFYSFSSYACGESSLNLRERRIDYGSVDKDYGEKMKKTALECVPESLHITSYPKGATLSVNNFSLPLKTPLTLVDPPKQNLHFKISYPKYSDYEFEYIFNPINKNGKLIIDLEKKHFFSSEEERNKSLHKYHLTLKSNPSGAIVLSQEGRKMGITPLKLVADTSNQIQLHVTLKGYKNFESTFNLEQMTEAEIILEPANSGKESRLK